MQIGYLDIHVSQLMDHLIMYAANKISFVR